MVSSDSQLIGLVAIILGFFVATKKGGSTVESVFRPVVQTSTQVQPVENPQIQTLKDSIKEVNRFISQTFKAPIRKPKEQLTRAERFQPLPKGSRFSINPFTGMRIALPVGPRGSGVTERFFGGAQQLQFNQNLVTQGQTLFSGVSDLLKGLKSELKILETNSV